MKGVLIVIHRYTGAALCLLFAAWFVSGVAMIYRREPPLTDGQRLAFSEPLGGVSDLVEPARVRELAAAWPDAETLRLGRWQGRAVYRWRATGTGWHAAWADTGTPASFDAPALAPEAARWFGEGTPFRYEGTFHQQSQWTYFSQAREHYPLHGFSTEGVGPRQVFFSSRTGEPIVATSLATRVLYYLGPGLHYFSFYPIRNNVALWRGLVNWSSGIGAASCLVGIVIGLWHLRWRAIGTTRRVIPYVKPWMRWHHWTGLLFGLVTFTFVLSGLFSMNPGGMFPSTAVPDPVRTAFLGARPALRALPSPAGAADAGIQDAKELEWTRVRGRAYVLARRDPATERMLWPHDGELRPRAAFSDAELVELVRDVVPAPVQSVERLTAFDDYYYARKYRHLPLPALRVRLQDAQATWYYLDPDTGGLFLKSDSGTRLDRWVWNGLHSFDTQFLLGLGVWWHVLIWALSVGGLALSVTGVVIAWRWLRRRVLPRLPVTVTPRPPKEPTLTRRETA